MSKNIQIAIAGVGNCASSLLQAIAQSRRLGRVDGLIRETVGPWGAGDIDVAAAFDIDARKVGRPLHEAAFAEPNCTWVFERDLAIHDAVVQMGPVLDGVAPHMLDEDAGRGFRPADVTPADVTQVLRDSGAQILVCYLPVGSEQAVRHYAQCCLEAGVGFVNCVPVFIASDPFWAARFESAGLPLVGDDIKSQLGATIVHRMLAWLYDMRGIRIERTYQLNTGGNTDFRNMLARDRLASKRKSKTASVQSMLDEPIAAGNVHIGPSDYVHWQADNKVCFLRMEGRGLGGSPVELELRLSVQDSPNSAGVVLDAVRCAALAMRADIAGALLPVCAAYMKSPPKQMHDLESGRLCDEFIDRLSRA